jgi:hypothetical protein
MGTGRKPISGAIADGTAMSTSAKRVASRWFVEDAD